MGLDALIRGLTGTQAEVDTNNQLKVNLPMNDVNAGFVNLAVEVDPGNVPLAVARYTKNLFASEDRRLSVGLDTPIFDYTFNATAQNTGLWYFTAGTTAMAATQASGFLTLNSGSVLTANAACAMQSKKYLPLRGNAGTHIEFNANISATPVANQVFEFGCFLATATGAAPAAPTDGVWYQLTSAGLIGVLAYNGTVTQTGTLVASVSVANNHAFRINITEAATEFWVDGAFLGEILTPTGNGQPFMTDALPICMQARNSATVTGTPALLRFANLHSDQFDLNLNKSYEMQQAVIGWVGYQGQDGGTMGSTAALTNSTNPTAAAGSNTAANITGLGGIGAINAAAGAATDYIASSFQVPAGGVNQTPRTLLIKGVRISAINNGAAVATTPTTLFWSLAFGHTAVSLATTESASFVSPSTKAPRRIPLGFMTAAVGAAIGAGYDKDIVVAFATPIPVFPGEFIASVMRQIVGTATASQTINYSVMFDAVWE